MLGTQEQRVKGMKKQAQELIDQTYQRGYKAGFEAAKEQIKTDTESRVEELISIGRNEAWEAAKKIAADCFNDSKMTKKLFNFHYSYAVFENFSASEAIENIKEYEKKKREEEQEIRVGDEVYIEGKEIKYVVVCIYKERSELVDCKGNFAWTETCSLHKTGKHFPEIENVENVLEKLKESECNE